VATLGLDHVAAGLDDRLGLLTTGRRAAAPRHQTLRATLDWSYELLSDFEQRLLCNLAVFQGGFAIESSTAAFGAEHSASDIAEGITRLLTKSLISPHGAEGRWRLLDTLRAYAIEKLEQVGEIGSARHRHAKYFCSFILANSEDARGTADVLVANVQDIDNVRAAIDWAFSTIGDNHIGIALTAAYIPVWCHFALFGECRERIEQALKCPAVSIDANARYRMQLHAGRAWVILASRSSCPETFDAWTKTLEIAEALADADFQLRALWGLFTEQITRGDCHVALRIAERFKTIAESTDRTDVLIGHRLMGNALHSLGRQSEAGSYNERFLAEEPALANQRPVGFSIRPRRDHSNQPSTDFVAARVRRSSNAGSCRCSSHRSVPRPPHVIGNGLISRRMSGLTTCHRPARCRVVGQALAGSLDQARDGTVDCSRSMPDGHAFDQEACR
jgi:hypothetical protein